MSGEKKILKFYSVDMNDIDDKGNINPDAKLLPLFSKQYNIRPKDVKATLSSDDWYDDSTNVHKDRHFTTFCKIIHVTDFVVKRHFVVTVNIGIFGKKR